MAKKLKTTDSNTETPSPTAEETVKESAPKHRPGKDLAPTFKRIGDASYIRVAGGKTGGVASQLLWAMRAEKDEPQFLFVFELPDGEEGTDLCQVARSQSAAQALYAGFARRVPHHALPPECPLELVVEKPRKSRKKKGEEEPSE
jgi:hypothetical protein